MFACERNIGISTQRQVAVIVYTIDSNRLKMLGARGCSVGKAALPYQSFMTDGGNRSHSRGKK